MWTSYINCVAVRNVLLRSCCGFGSMFNLAALGAITFFYTGDGQTRCLDPFISFVRGNVSFLLWCLNELRETLWTMFGSPCPPHGDSFTQERTKTYKICIIKTVVYCENMSDPFHLHGFAVSVSLCHLRAKGDHTPPLVSPKHHPPLGLIDLPRPVDSLSVEKDQRDSCSPLIEVSSSSWMATMGPCMQHCTIKTNHSARRWLFGYCMRLMPWEMLTIQYIWTARGFSLMREDFRVCYELWTGGTAGPDGFSASKFVRLERSHWSRLHPRRHALILWQRYPDWRGRISYYQL